MVRESQISGAVMHIGALLSIHIYICLVAPLSMASLPPDRQRDLLPFRIDLLVVMSAMFLQLFISLLFAFLVV